FSGEDEGNGEVVLTWAENTEADLRGYRLFRCYARGGEFAVTGPEVLTGTTFTDNLGGKIINDSIYYRLQAEDGRANASEQTPVLVVARVDITPPGKPTLARVNATPSGIAVTWKYSADDDVVRHELQRRPRGTRDWTVVVSVAAEAEEDYLVENFDAAGSVNYVDETDLPLGDYEYQFLAFDEMNLGAGSEIVGIRPHDSGERGEIEDLAISFACTDSTTTTYLDETVNELMIKIIEASQAGAPLTEMERKAILMGMEMSGLVTRTQFPEWAALSDADFGLRVAQMRGANAPNTTLTNCSIKLQWSYPLDASLQHFQLYRSRRGSRLWPYQALPVNYFFTGSVPTGRQLLTFVDRDAQPGVRYVYKVMAVHWDGGYSKEGRGVTVVVE
ncbi:MAG: fibronectin type III domain-containing protein, partial [Lewinella sp.]